MTEPLTYFEFQKHSVFIPLKYVYNECFFLIDEHPRLSPLQCFNSSCHVMKSCPEILAKRVHYLFTEVMPEAKHMYLYFKYRDRPKSIRAGFFDKDLNEPKTIVLNQAAFKKFKDEGLTYQWVPTNEFLFLGKSENIIPVSNLIKLP